MRFIREQTTKGNPTFGNRPSKVMEWTGRRRRQLLRWDCDPWSHTLFKASLWTGLGVAALLRGARMHDRHQECGELSDCFREQLLKIERPNLLPLCTQQASAIGLYSALLPLTAVADAGADLIINERARQQLCKLDTNAVLCRRQVVAGTPIRSGKLLMVVQTSAL
ncbi:hypothetical protein GN244_ATG02527 [Phytophthora infestans]|uniref:Uncharacterized protein n=1 Tax=Phytophthora infestans TaxID=4787 RepID=A0A833T868_PHYIN|nr:hypothetical protein GN244_ATG02527 [Phytophthora infestans]KAF4149951.1 hypothetical protein GN958_ATG00890 [Phytophthora infestans]